MIDFPTPPLPLSFQPARALRTAQALAHADALLHCASAVAYESADQHKGQARHLALTVVHLVDMARVLVVHGLEADPAPGDTKAAEADD
ncbi:hypothetical protein [Pseudomonas sp. RIT-PI-S]|uniref:DUF6124 family protein n=1 Tax=Pseudomonas sp. RIT-PI-S TaxID=3035295 RepID=UPI0021DA2D29|nr:hypothetical protein [Pseudomonas sp. RIT-PI-S]